MIATSFLLPVHRRCVLPLVGCLLAGAIGVAQAPAVMLEGGEPKPDLSQVYIDRSGDVPYIHMPRWGEAGTTDGSVVAPEPSTALLAICSGLSLLTMRRFRR